MREICRLLNIDKLHTTAYKASTNAAIERFHRTLNSMLGKVVSERQDDWDLMLPYVMAAYRSSIHDSTGYSPNMLMHARENRAPVDIVYGMGDVPVESSNYDEYVESVKDRLQSAYTLVRDHIGKAAERNKRYYDIRVKPTRYQRGDWVYYFNPRRYKGRQDKWSRKYTGPFCVIRVPGPVNVELQKTRKSRPFIVHIDKVKPYLGEQPISWLTDNIDVTTEARPIESDDLSVVNDTDSPIIPDVITMNEEQEFRRNRPRRQAPLPTRYRS